MPRLRSSVTERKKKSQSAPRKDPRHTPVDYSTGFDELACKNPDRHYVQVDPRSNLFGQGYYEHVKGYQLELNTEGGVFCKRKGRGHVGTPVEGMFGTVVMSIDMETKLWLDENGISGKGGQKKVDRLEKAIFNDPNKQSGDPFRGMLAPGLAGYARVSGQSTAAPLGKKEAHDILESS